MNVSTSKESAMAALLVCNIGWMSRYEGLKRKPDKIVGGGQYVEENQKGGEVCNFLCCGDGYVYGYVETVKGDVDRQIRIENLGANPNAKRIDGIDVVWIATNPEERGRRVIGWYRNATLYRNRQPFEGNGPSAQHRRDALDGYRIRAKNENITLLPFEDRSKPAFRLGKGTGWIGQANWWFPEQQSHPAIKEFVRGLRAIIDCQDEGISTGGGKGKWGGNSDIERKAQVEQVAIREVKKYYEKNYTVETKEKDNVGWDLEANPKYGGNIICLEVKGLFGSKLRVGVTPNEYRAIVKHIEGKKPDYRFCVVTNTLSDKPILTIFRYEPRIRTWFDDILNKPTTLTIEPLESAIIYLAP